MRRIFVIVVLAGSVISFQAFANCIKDQYGKVVCGKGKCMRDTYGNVFCADVGGGVMRDEYGKVECGIGKCAKDYLGKVWCSKQPAGGAAADSYGKVKCLGACEPGSIARCKKAQ